MAIIFYCEEVGAELGKGSQYHCEDMASRIAFLG